MGLWQDFRFAVRLLVKDRLVTAMAVVALALGIGANNTVFTCVNAALLRGLPYEHPERILHVNTRMPSTGRDDDVSYPELADMRIQASAFASLAAYQPGTMNLSDARHPPERLSGGWMSANAFETLGQKPLIGRGFLPGEDEPGAERVVILGYGVWADRYGADPAVLGRTVRVNEEPATIVGVMPKGVKFPMDEDLWQPLAPGADRDRRGARSLGVFGRLRDGATLEGARAQMRTIFARLAKQYPETNKDVEPVVLPYNERFAGGPIRVVFMALLGAVAFVLLIACANVANLMLARSATRAREMAVRVSLGATRWRIVRQLLVESLLIAAIAGALGFWLSKVGVAAFDRGVSGTGKPYWIVFTMDYTVLFYMLGICLATALLFGLAPALHVARTDVHETLKEGGRGGGAGARARRFTSSLVVAELALTVVLLAGAGLMIRSFLTLYRMDVGIRTDRVLTMRMMLAERKYPQAADWTAFHDRLAQRLASVPGLTSAALASNLPFAGGDRRELEMEGRPTPVGQAGPQVSVVRVSPGYFETLELRLRAGRAFSDRDGRPGAEAAIVNERWVGRFSPGADPLGSRIHLKTRDSTSPWLTVVGVAPNVHQGNPQRDPSPDPVVYVPFRQEPQRSTFLVARGPADPTALANVLRQEVREVDADQPVFRVMTLSEALALNRWPYRVFGGLLGVFALIALVLSTIGLYAVTSYSVALRSQEIGVRVALGATGRQVTWLVLRGAARQLAIGLVLGLGAALGLARFIRGILVQSTADDPTTYLAVVAIFVVVTIVASVVPSRRATRLDPLVVLRAE